MAPSSAQPREFTVDADGGPIAAWHVPATSDAWTTPSGRPVVVMAHGFACTKDSGLLPFAERFAAAGADVVLFDYRGFGASGGPDRQRVDHRRHREDYRTVLAHVRARRTGLDDVDPDRVVLWGSSYSGGHVVAVAAEDPVDGRSVAGVISQGAAMDGLKAVLEILRYAGPRQLLRLTAHALLGFLLALVGRRHRIAVVGKPGALAAITSEDGEPGYLSIAGPTFRNELDARSILPIMLNRPVAVADRVTAPLMLVVAEHDTIAPPAAVEEVARRARGRVVVERYPVGHFDIYLGEPFERSVAAQVAFLGTLW